MPPPLALPFPIPDSILLLLILHLLGWPSEAGQCDPEMFDPSRHGIGERIKTTEQIVYFLIEQGEGEQRAKALLPMYPCKKPADTTLFRNTVVKYLEGLRAAALKQQTVGTSPSVNTVKKIAPGIFNQIKAADTAPRRVPSSIRSVSASVSMRSTSGSSATPSQRHGTRSVSTNTSKSTVSKTSAKQGTTQSSGSTKASGHGWWWKDVPVRRTLLEECTGSKFERMILALSLHALASRTERSGTSNKEDLEANMLSEQPDSFRDIVQRLSLLRARLVQQKSTLLQQRHYLHILRSSLHDTTDESPNLNFLLENNSKLLRSLGLSWASSLKPEGEACDATEQGDTPATATWLLGIMGLFKYPGNSEGITGNGGSLERPREGIRPSVAGAATSRRKTVLPAPSLPVVAAHYASHLQSLTVTKEELQELRADAEPDSIPLDGSESAVVAPQGGSKLYDGLASLESYTLKQLNVFVDEMAELESNLIHEMKVKNEVLRGATQQAQMLDASHLWIPTDHFGLDFSTARPYRPSSPEPTQQRLEITRAIQHKIEAAVAGIAIPRAEPEDDLHEDVMDEEETAGAYDSDPIEDSNSSSNPSIVNDKSPIKPTRIPFYSQTPPRPSPSKATTTTNQPSTPPKRNFESPWFQTPTTVKFQQTPKPQKTPIRGMPTPSFFLSPGDGLEDLRTVLPPFQSPWRSVARAQRSPQKGRRVSMGKPRTSIHRPRMSKGRVGSSSSFTRTPLKNGKRLSNIIPPVNFSLAAKLGHATPRASLDDVYEEIVDDLVQNASVKTPPLSTSARRLLDSSNNIQRSSPYKSLHASGRGPRTPSSPDGDSTPKGAVASMAVKGALGFGEWEDVLEEAQSSDSDRTSKAQRLASSHPRFSEGPSFSLHDVLLQVGRQGMMGANGTFNFDLLHDAEVDMENYSMLDDL